MSGRVLHVDLETRSCVDLRKTGAHKYAEDPTTTIVCGSYRFDDGPVRQWLGTEIPGEVAEHLAVGGKMAGHNQQFERVVLNEWLPCLIEPEQQDCTMARGLALALPASLGQLAQALNLTVPKDQEGARLMMQMCRPRKVDDDGTVTWWDQPDKVERLGRYCDTDVEVETLADKALPPLSESERQVWALDQLINDRGVAVDVHMIERALEAVEEALTRADRQMWRLTDGAVKRCSEAAKIVAWLNSRGVTCTSIAKGEVDELIVTSQVLGDETAEQVIRLRRAAAKSSTAKFKAMLNCVCADGRARGALQYHGAGQTGRWAGRLWQPQNFPRVDPDRDLPDVMRILDLLDTPKSRRELVDSIELLTDTPLDGLSKCLRAMIVAGPGKKLSAATSATSKAASTHGRPDETVEADGVPRLRRRPRAPTSTRSPPSDILGKPIEEIAKFERQAYGKVPELACGYQGGVGAFLKMAYTQDPPVRVTEAEAKRIVSAWREKNYHIVQGWWEIQDAAIEAVGAPGCVVYCRGNKVAYTVSNGFLWCLLPSGRVIAYAKPRLVWKEIEAPTEGEWANGMAGEGPIYIPPTEGRYKRVVEYMGVDSLTKRWSVQSLYGGSQMNHVVQGTARDRMVEAMFAVEDAGLPLVLTVHDELLSEVPVGTASAEQYADLMMREPDWAAGLPVAVKTWKDVRYVK
jgi:DNA polymerase